MGVKLTAEEARKAGIKKLESAGVKRDPRGITIDNPRNGYICYIGPCDENGYREVCYYDDGCTDCYLESC